ncbi:MAG: 50S ribosomal protein L18 [Pirellulaceae bacterium]|nr:50S ribosomal protein L18 [Pirellulaceae bacterium]
MDKQRYLTRQRSRRRFRVRKPIRGSSDRPRLSISRSLKNMSAQIIDDSTGRTLAAASTLDATLRTEVKYGGNKAAAQAVGKALAEKALAAGIKDVCFDRGHNKYHGRVAALADAAREAGLSF